METSHFICIFDSFPIHFRLLLLLRACFCFKKKRKKEINKVRCMISFIDFRIFRNFAQLILLWFDTFVISYLHRGDNIGDSHHPLVLGRRVRNENPKFLCGISDDEEVFEARSRPWLRCSNERKSDIFDVRHIVMKYKKALDSFCVLSVSCV